MRDGWVRMASRTSMTAWYRGVEISKSSRVHVVLFFKALGSR